jgi:hypothetical protein
MTCLWSIDIEKNECGVWLRNEDMDLDAAIMQRATCFSKEGNKGVLTNEGNGMWSKERGIAV